MKRPVTSLCRRPGKKRPPAGQSVPDAGTISAHRDALRRSGGAAGQKPPERGRKNSPGRGPGLCTGCAQQGNGGHRVLDVVKYHTGHWAPARTEGIPGRKNSPRRGPGTVRRLRPWESGGNGRCLVPGSITLGARRGREHVRAQKQSPARARSCVQAAPHGGMAGNGVSGAGKAPHWAHVGAEGTPGRKNSPRRGPEAVWMRDMGVTCPGRSV